MTREEIIKKPKHPFEEEWYSKVSHETQTVALQVYFDELEVYNNTIKKLEEKVNQIKTV